MSDNDYRTALLFHLSENSKQCGYLLRGKHRCRLVKDKNVCALVERLHYLYSLFFADRHIVYLLVGGNVKAVFLVQLVHMMSHALFRCDKMLYVTHYHVFCGGHYIDQLEVLMYHTDARLYSVTG